MADTKQTARKSKPTPGLATYQGGTVSSSSEEQEMESTLSEIQGETGPTQRESSEQTEQPRISRKRKRGDRTAASSLSSVDHTPKTWKVAVEYSTDETDEDKIPEMGKGMALPRKMKTVKLTLPATPSQVHLARSFIEWFAYYGMRPGMRAALVSRKWPDGMTEEQVDETAARVATKLGAVQGWQHIVNSFDRAQIAIILAVGIRKIEEFEILKGKRAKDDVTPFLR